MDPIYVTKPSLPDLEDFIPYLKKIWNTKILTNQGPFHKQFENELAEYLGVKYISLFTNATLALITAIQALKISGKVITTPYSFVATTHSLYWNRIEPVFVDINENDFNIDVNKIEAAITPDVTAIFPVHVYGNPCNLKKINEISEIYGLKVIYDAAHAFGVKQNNETILNYGDLSVLSFHATKVFTTFEGGSIISHDEKTKRRIDYLKNFGFADETTVIAPGINAKMSEIQSALGLLQLKNIDVYIQKRKEIADYYRNELKSIEGISYLEDFKDIKHNYAYFPILVEDTYKLSRDELYEKLKENNIYTRRYFYPLISNFPMYKGLKSSSLENLPIANKTAEKVLCLPMYSEISKKELNKIIEIILE